MPTVAELKEICKELGIKGYSKWNKEELLENCKTARSPKRKSKSPKRKSKSPKRKSKSPKRKSKSPKRKSKSPKRKSKSPKRKSKSPKRKSKSPKRKSKSPKRQRSATKNSSQQQRPSVSASASQFLNDDAILQILLNMDIATLEESCRVNKQFNRVCKENHNRILRGLLPAKTKEQLLPLIQKDDQLLFVKEYNRAPSKMGKNPWGNLYTKDEFIEILLKKGNDLALNRKLHLACYYNLTAIAKYLISTGADITSKDSYMAYHRMRGGPRQPNDHIHVYNNDFIQSVDSILYYPVKFGAKDTVQFILDQRKIKYDTTSLAYAVQEKDYEMVEMLLKGGIELNRYLLENPDNVAHTFRGDVLGLAAKNNNVKMMQLLIRYGANNFKDALKTATKHNKTKAIEILKEL